MCYNHYLVVMSEFDNYNRLATLSDCMLKYPVKMCHPGSRLSATSNKNLTKHMRDRYSTQRVFHFARVRECVHSQDQ